MSIPIPSKTEKVYFYSRKRYKKIRLLENDFVPPVSASVCVEREEEAEEEQRRHKDGNKERKIKISVLDQIAFTVLIFVSRKRRRLTYNIIIKTKSA